MTFAAAGVLAGLVLLVPLVALHLRRRGEAVREVPSLVLWEELELVEAPRARGLRSPPLPWLLALQMLALALLVFALAEPAAHRSREHPEQVIVLDDSWRMQAAGRITQARRDVEQALARDAAGTVVRIVLAAAPARVYYSGTVAGARSAAARLTAGYGPPDLSAALTIAAGSLEGPQDSILVLHAPEDALPAVRARAGQLQSRAVGGPVADQGIFGAGARCGIGASRGCEVYATVRNTGEHEMADRVEADAAGRAPLLLTIHVGPRASAPLALESNPGQQVSLRLTGADPLPADDRAWVIVPGAAGEPTASLVTLVGSPSVAIATARAFAAVPGVTLRLRTRSSFRSSDGSASSLVILDHWLPAAGLPASPAVLLVDPPRLPGGSVGAPLAETVVSGSSAGSELLAGVELSALSITPRAAIHLSLPPWLAPVLWSPAGTLLAAGANGGQRLAVLAFEPGQSDLPQLPALPILAANLVRWAAAWAPSKATAGVPFSVEAPNGITAVSLSRAGGAARQAKVGRRPVSLEPGGPGLYSVSEQGGQARRSATVAVNAGEAAPAGAVPLELATAGSAAESAPPSSELTWFLAAALLALLLEWWYWANHRSGIAA